MLDQNETLLLRKNYELFALLKRAYGKWGERFGSGQFAAQVSSKEEARRELSRVCFLGESRNHFGNSQGELLLLIRAKRGGKNDRDLAFDRGAVVIVHLSVVAINRQISQMNVFQSPLC